MAKGQQKGSFQAPLFEQPLKRLRQCLLSLLEKEKWSRLVYRPHANKGGPLKTIVMLNWELLCPIGGG